MIHMYFMWLLCYFNLQKTRDCSTGTSKVSDRREHGVRGEGDRTERSSEGEEGTEKDRGKREKRLGWPDIRSEGGEWKGSRGVRR